MHPTENGTPDHLRRPHRENPGQQSSEEPPKQVSHILKNLSPRTFDEWWAERQISENIREGKPYFNGPSPVQPPERHSPSRLLQCSRKLYYSQLNAPEETRDPRGIFWAGTQIEEDIIVPFLDDAVAGANEYVANSLWVDFTVETQAGDLHIKGATDPTIVSQSNDPILLTEIKSKKSIADLQQPDRHHKAQLHAYMAGLTREHDKQVKSAVILYCDRTTFDIKPIHVQFDSTFWRDTVLDWATRHSTYRLDNTLPPAEPEHDWECSYCDYQERCGKGDREFEDEDATGLLPLFDYPRSALVEYLNAHKAVKLTPSLAHLYPDLAEEYDVHDWTCRGCGSTFDWDTIQWTKHTSRAPRCPHCNSKGDTRLLSGPQPAQQPPTGDH